MQVMSERPEAQFLKRAAQMGQAPGAQGSNKRRPLLSSDEGMRQLHSKMDAERMSDEEFDALWRELRTQALAHEAQRNKPLAAEDLQSTTSPALFDASDEPYVVPTPQNEYWITGEMDVDEEIEQTVDIDKALPTDIEQNAPAAPEMTFEEAVAHLTNVVTRTNRFREIHLKTLNFCMNRRGLTETEDHIQTYPEYEYAAQNPYRLICYLIDGGGLRLIELDEDGQDVTADRKLGLTEDEVDDLVCSFALETTPVGEQVAEDLAPKNRIRDLLNFMPVRFDTYVELMNFCNEPRTMTQINELFSGRDLHFLGTMHSDKTIAIQPSALVDKLERAGALVWKGQWKLTPEGQTFLKTLSQAS